MFYSGRKPPGLLGIKVEILKILYDVRLTVGYVSRWKLQGSKFGAMLVRPRPVCPRPKILGCCIPWTKCPLAILPLTKPSHP